MIGSSGKSLDQAYWCVEVTNQAKSRPCKHLAVSVESAPIVLVLDEINIHTTDRSVSRPPACREAEHTEAAAFSAHDYATQKYYTDQCCENVVDSTQ